ncbi:hypothetical protein [Paludibacterium purpuratum]|uniref:Uncharacterized protein n=1 Tax=Paludibacterium purpuratum TaxID=1144873 RepID=A0A4R7B223_9NEIS|nr:hypothetical protein [Paludibacterium purpuratum]TDR73798.1 hypothetical protein DFP86_1122 [Paludibacterium purpuratum]
MKFFEKTLLAIAVFNIANVAFAQDVYKEYVTDFSCGRMTVAVIATCKHSEDGFQPGDCKMPFGMRFLKDGKILKSISIPALSAREVGKYNKAGTYSTLFPRALECVQDNRKQYLHVFYYGSSNASPFNELHEYYQGDNEKVNEGGANALYQRTMSVTVSPKSVDVNIGVDKR